MSIVTLQKLTFLSMADYRPWGCHMCKFGAVFREKSDYFPTSPLYHENKVFVKMEMSQCIYDYIARRYFPEFTVTPPCRFLIDTNATRIAYFQRTAPSGKTPQKLVHKWRQINQNRVHASVVPLYAFKSGGRRLYDGTGDCTRFMQKRGDYMLFQIVFLDYLFGNFDRVANCFMINGRMLALDTGFSKKEAKKVNFGHVSDYLSFHVRTNSTLLHDFKRRYPTWYRHLTHFSDLSTWISIQDLDTKYIEGVVLQRARTLLRTLDIL